MGSRWDQRRSGLIYPHRGSSCVVLLQTVFRVSAGLAFGPRHKEILPRGTSILPFQLSIFRRWFSPRLANAHRSDPGFDARFSGSGDWPGRMVFELPLDVRRSLLSRNLAAWTAFRDPMASEEGAKARNLDVLARRFCDVARLEAIVEFS